MDWRLGIRPVQVVSSKVALINEPAKLAAEFSPGQAQRNEVKRSAALGNLPKEIVEPALARDRYMPSCGGKRSHHLTLPARYRERFCISFAR